MTSPVTLVTQFYAPEELGTAFYTHDLARAVNDSPGWTLDVLTGEPYYPRFEKFTDYKQHIPQETIDDITLQRIRTIVPRQGSTGWRIVSELNFLLRGAIGVLTGRYARRDYVISFSPGTVSVALGALLTRKGGNHICIVHDIASGLAGGTGMVRDGAVLRVLRAVETATFNRCDVVAALSHQMARSLIDLGVKPSIIRIIPLWLRNEMLAHEPTAIRPLQPIALYSGSLGKKQGLDRLLDLAAGLRDEVPAARLVIRGDGPMRAQLAARVKQEELSNVDILPPVPHSDLSSALAESWIHLVPQEPAGASFSVPSKVLNALAAGRPAIATAKSGTALAQLADECEAVRVVDPDDPAALVAVVKRHLSDVQLCQDLGVLGFRYVKDNYGRDPIVKAILATLRAPSNDAHSAVPRS